MESPDLPEIFRALAASDVRWILTGSLAAAAHGAPLRARDVDVTPALDVDNLHRVARFLEHADAKPHFTEKGSLTREECEAWEPFPVALANLDYLFRTRHGLVDVVPELAGTYHDLSRNAVSMEAFGVQLRVAAGEDVLAAVRAKERRKNTARREAYASLERRVECRSTARADEGDGTSFRRVDTAERPFADRELLEAAERLLTDRAGCPARLQAPEPVVSGRGYRNRLLRCEVVAESGDLPPTVLLKQTNLRTGELFREWAGLEWLDRLPAAAPFCPRFFGGDRDRRFLLLEDLGDVRDRDLASLLVGRDRTLATQALLGAAEAAGALQSATIGAATDYAAIVDSLPRIESRAHAADRLVDSLRALAGRFASAGVEFSAAANSETEVAAREIEEPGGFLAYTRGDVCTKNVVLTSTGTKVFDLEYGGFRHALVDGAFFGLRHLACLYAGRFPEAVRHDAESAYRTALARGCPAAADDGAWGHGFASVSAGWLATLLEPLAPALESDRRRGSATQRQRILGALREFEGIAARLSRLPALGDAAGRLRAALESRWNVAPLAVHAAFR